VCGSAVLLAGRGREVDGRHRRIIDWHCPARLRSSSRNLKKVFK
jgi:hypothetical protein